MMNDKNVAFGEGELHQTPSSMNGFSSLTRYQPLHRFTVSSVSPPFPEAINRAVRMMSPGVYENIVRPQPTILVRWYHETVVARKLALDAAGSEKQIVPMKVTHDPTVVPPLVGPLTAKSEHRMVSTEAADDESVIGPVLPSHTRECDSQTEVNEEALMLRRIICDPVILSAISSKRPHVMEKLMPLVKIG